MHIGIHTCKRFGSVVKDNRGRSMRIRSRTWKNSCSRMSSVAQLLLPGADRLLLGLESLILLRDHVVPLFGQSIPLRITTTTATISIKLGNLAMAVHTTSLNNVDIPLQGPAVVLGGSATMLACLRYQSLPPPVSLFGRLEVPYQCLGVIFGDAFAIRVKPTQAQLSGDMSLLSSYYIPLDSLGDILDNIAALLVPVTNNILGS